MRNLYFESLFRKYHRSKSGWGISILVDPLHLGFDVSPESIDQRSLFRTRYSPFTRRTTVRPGRSAAKSSSHDKLDNLIDHTALPS